MARQLWAPSAHRVAASNMTALMDIVNQRFNLDLTTYSALYQWSVDRMPDFWETFFSLSGIRLNSPYAAVIDDPGKMPGARWFQGATLNYAKNLLAFPLWCLAVKTVGRCASARPNSTPG